MTEPEEETRLDLVVNVVPIGILAFFSLLFMVVDPWGWDPFPVLMTHFLTPFPLVLLALLTYGAGRVIQRNEGESTEAGQ